MAALGLVVDETVFAPAAVVEAALPVDEPVGAAVVPEPAEPLLLEEAQVTAEGTVTPWAAQNFEAYSTAEAWSEALQAPTRQQAMPLRKFLSAQMQAALMEEQLPMLPPVVNFVRQAVCESRKGSAWSWGVQSGDTDYGLTAQVGREPSSWARTAPTRVEATKKAFMLNRCDAMRCDEMLTDCIIIDVEDGKMMNGGKAESKGQPQVQSASAGAASVGKVGRVG